MTLRSLLVVLPFAALAVACGGGSPPAESPAGAASATEEAAPAESAPAAEEAAPADSAAAPAGGEAAPAAE